ncbi:SMI1 / KNR4 family (SUKH-1) [Catalinimonas alkaloidigena]|uniref:SMI1 / KNR4 family (SUKH-1) n=1 Tax=Catalinimonas alkaloidigena TaxID=1075417 RepID=A0A1G8ZP74_9BACT|nr:SMI1 / KNR4 family (SUKH-1) [Catalinimonas alkaloidigena]
MPFPIDEEHIRKAEAELGLLFPQAYRSRMAHVNGGELDSEEWEIELFPIPDTSDRKRLSRTANHVGLETMKAKQWADFPAHSLAIGTDGWTIFCC